MPSDLILIVESESKWVHLLRQILVDAGFTVQATNRGETAVKMVAGEQPALLITDTRLTGNLDGFELIRRIRDFSDIPVIILTGSDSPDDELQGFETGADDYIKKPFDSRLFLARVKSVLNRCRGRENGPAEILCGEIQINLAARQVISHGEPVYLTETEYNLLVELARHCNKVMLHEQLLMAVWGQKFSTEVDYLRSFIHILRRKLESNPSQPSLIVSRPGIGYMLVANPKEDQGKRSDGKLPTV